MNSDNIEKVLKLFPDLSEEQIINVKTYGRKANRANYVLQINSELYPYNGERYVMIGDWFYIVGRFPHYNNNTYTLYIEHTLNLEGLVVK
jgi:hypothetical protein